MLVVVIILVLWGTIQDIKYKKIEDSIEYEYLGKVKIDPDINEVLDEFSITKFSGYSGEIISVEELDKAEFFPIRNEDEKIELEKRLDTIIDIKLDFSKERVYAIVGSEIDYFDVQGWYFDEITVEKTNEYKVFINYKDKFDGNIIYFYWIEKEGFYFIDHSCFSNYSSN